ncbi:hypothetical protein LJR289_004825 [Pseudoduganella sp. LjRoot289]|uniref:DUF6600 domain-containing protein n=1 Tax=Pseudoduganella sp. LjRoot289 TaxID=3342314 RepID=UPI003ECFA60D
MHRKLAHFILLAALVAASSLALADEDPPARVGRISSTQGQVTVEADGEEASGSLLNWPVASGSRITAAPGARMEFRVGSAAVRLDGDSSLEVDALDDNSLRLRLNYGTASVRLRSAELLGDFELSTPQARVTMLEPGWVRVDSERQPDTSSVTVLAGAARVDGAGSELILRAGKRALVYPDRVATGVALRDSFDDWVQARDKRDENSQSLRYVTADVTGYEELDQYGSWRDNPEYGPLWSPRSVPAGWAPYRDGRWTWLDPWGWTWVDDLPWGYAPSHYGRWVMLDTRWYWAPGRSTTRPVWAPALVGWVGGSNWSVAFADRRSGPGVGWYPLTPRDSFVPGYRVSPDYERRLGWQHHGSVNWKPQREVRREGVTVLPREQFDARRTVNVNKAPRISLAPNDARNVPLSTAPLPVTRMSPGGVVPGRVIETRRDRDDWRQQRFGAGRQQSSQIQTQPQAMPFAQPPAAAPAPAALPRPQQAERALQPAAADMERRARQDRDREDDRDRDRDRERDRDRDRRDAEHRANRQSILMQQAQPQPPAQHPFAQPPQAAPAARPQPQAQPQMQAQPQPPQPQPQGNPFRQQREEQRDHQREQREHQREQREPREAAFRQPQPAPQPAPQAVARPQPAPQAAPQPAQPQHQQQQREDRRQSRDREGKEQKDR